MRKTKERMEEEYKNSGVERTEDIERQLQQYESSINYNSPCQMTVINPDPTKDYYWAAKSVYNEEIPGWEQEMARGYWSPVRNTDLPEMAAAVSSGAFKGSASGYIQYGGSILYSRDKRFGEIERKKRLQQEMDLRKAMNYMNPDQDIRYQNNVVSNTTYTSALPEV
jgi:hypothetical protein